MTAIFDKHLSHVDMDHIKGRGTCIGFCYLFVICIVLILVKSTMTNVLCYHTQYWLLLQFAIETWICFVPACFIVIFQLFKSSCCTIYVPGGHSTFFGMINTFVHIIMYLYYLFAAFGPRFQKYLWWKKYLTMLQMVGMWMMAVGGSF
jgi:hypothetical protein